MAELKTKTTDQRPTRVVKVINDFDAENLAAPFSLRCGAIIIDYMLLVSIPIAAVLINRAMGVPDTKLFKNQIYNTSWLIVVLLILSNFILLPLFAGQTVGKSLTGLRIIKTDGTTPSLVSLVLRHIIGYPVSLIFGGLGFVVALFGKGRALHDFFAGTIVIYGNRKVTEQVIES